MGYKYGKSEYHWLTKKDVIDELDPIEWRLANDVRRNIELKFGAKIPCQIFSLVVDALIENGIVEERESTSDILLKLVFSEVARQPLPEKNFVSRAA